MTPTPTLAPPPVPPVRHVGPPRLSAGMDHFARLDLPAHQRVHGPMPQLGLDALVELAELIQLRGRGGAGFPFARKVRAVAQSARTREAATVVVVNATEGEPASGKDKALLARAPHLVLDGAALAAQALGASAIAIGVAEGEIGTQSLLRAVAERRMPAATRVVTVPARFISGEGGALVRGISGELPIPPGRKVRASDSGVGGLPTLLSNAETYAQLAVAARLGPRGYAAIGVRGEPGTVLLTVGGAVLSPGVIEVPTGMPLRDVLWMCRASAGPAVLTGGYHGTWITAAAAARAVISRDGLSAVGGTLGAGIVLALGEGTCPLGEANRVVQYLAGESAGQCGPCRRGLPDLGRALATLADGAGGSAAIEAIRAAAGGVKGRGACAHPDGTARFALSAIETFADDVAAHVHRGGCGQPVKGVLPIPPQARTGGRLAVDWTRCDGHGLCAHLVPELISLDGNGFPALPDRPVPEWLESDAHRAVSMCPALALRMTQRSATSAS